MQTLAKNRLRILVNVEQVFVSCQACFTNQFDNLVQSQKNHKKQLTKATGVTFYRFNPVQPSVAFHTETSHLICLILNVDLEGGFDY